MEQLDFIRNIAQAPCGILVFILAAPLAGFLINGARALWAAGRKGIVGEGTSSFFACSGAILSFVFSFAAFQALRAQPDGTILTQNLFSWIESGTLKVSASLQMDALSALMALFVTFVSSVIHVYSIGYMKKDPGFTRYFSYLNLFLFFMLLLTLADGLLLMFVGWEGVGLCSYLLISFWFEDETKAEAGKKAFLVNRVGDAGFLIGMFILFASAGSLQFAELQASRETLSPLLATAACLALFLGAAGKSAQIPLYVWLPDAMAGPTPVSALIHAATMVTAGVYMVARMHFLYAQSPAALTVVAVVGALTALMAAVIALKQNDIKKVLAYSTISQLGFMFLGAGSGGYSSGIFHVMTHAFFKSCLFLGAGSVIHALHGEQDIRKMGGLLKHVPVTGITFGIAWLSISGFPFLSGFFSKDAILWRTIATPNLLFPWLPVVLFLVAAFTSFLTAFYMTRLMVLTFFGEFRGTPEQREHLHESPLIMTVPLMVLAFFSVTAGWLGVPHAVGGGDHVGKFLEPLFAHTESEASGLSESLEPLFMMGSSLIALFGIGAALFVYLRRPAWAVSPRRTLAALGRLVEQKFCVDELYDATVLALVRFASRRVSMDFVDRLLIERTIEGATGATKRFAGIVRRLQAGPVRVALAYVLAGAALLLYWASR